LSNNSNSIAIALNTRDRVEQVKKILPSLLQPDKYDLYWFDGSETVEGQKHPLEYPEVKGHFGNVKGSGDNAVVVALTYLLDHTPAYDYIGICEDDVLLDRDWFERTFGLFDMGRRDGLEVGAVSARAYEDRVLSQRDTYAVMHNLGWGHVLLSRRAAELTLKHYRTGWSIENRRVFAQISGRDIGAWWAFRGKEQWICSDWGADASLACYGLSSLALTPSACDMIGQDPPLDKQGLRLANRILSTHQDDRVFEHIVTQSDRIRCGNCRMMARPVIFRMDERDVNSGGYFYFSHQLGSLSARWKGTWGMKHSLGFGPFGFRADGPDCSLTLKVAGPCEVLIGAGEKGGKALVIDTMSGYEIEPVFDPPSRPESPLFMNVAMPAGVSYRTIQISRIDEGLMVFGLRTRERQLYDPRWSFSADDLPAALLSGVG
jgi:hypothetical protein